MLLRRFRSPCRGPRRRRCRRDRSVGRRCRSAVCPLLQKFGSRLDLESPSWATAFANVSTIAPRLGHGPHAFGALQGSYVAGLDLPAWLPVGRAGGSLGRTTCDLELLAEQGIYRPALRSRPGGYACRHHRVAHPTGPQTETKSARPHRRRRSPGPGHLRCRPSSSSVSFASGFGSSCSTLLLA